MSKKKNIIARVRELAGYSETDMPDEEIQRAVWRERKQARGGNVTEWHVWKYIETNRNQ